MIRRLNFEDECFDVVLGLDAANHPAGSPRTRLLASAPALLSAAKV